MFACFVLTCLCLVQQAVLSLCFLNQPTLAFGNMLEDLKIIKQKISGENFKMKLSHTRVWSMLTNFKNFFSFGSQTKCWQSELHLTKGWSERQTDKTLIRLLPQKQSDLDLPCLSRN